MSKNILAEIEALRQWVAYRLTWDEKKEKTKKIPINPHDGTQAKANDPTTWGTYEEAMTFAMRQGLIAGKSGGIGFEFANGYAGIDLDDVIDEKGNLTDYAAEIVQIMNSYTEISPSDKGIHILFKIDVPLSEIGSIRKNTALGIEVYDTGRYFTVTGKIYGECKPIQERTEECKKVYVKYFIQEEKINSIKDWKYRPQDYNPNGRKPQPEPDLLELMFNSESGQSLRALYNGDFSGYGSQSEADLALCNHLAFWTSKNPQRIDELFRASGLYRPKWDEKHDSAGNTYGQITIAKAINSTNHVYEPHEQHGSTQTQALHTQVGGDMLSYMLSGFQHDLANFASFKNRKTGFENIDKFNSLYPGLYVIGGVSGVGKTTFAQQIADNLARAGEYILFFTLEQSRFELASKALSRLTSQDNFTRAKTALDIRNSRITDAVEKAIETYKIFASHETFIEGGFNISNQAIIKSIQDYMQLTGRKPIVFIDYLQIIAPSNSKKATKEAVDEHVHALKKLQVDNSLVMFVISSFNRTNYLTIADFESFKESGLIEYSADVVWALQLLAMNAGIFDKEAKTQSKRNFVHEAKKAEPRKIELISLKNRYGRSYARYFFKYYAQYDLFTPYDITEEQADKEVEEAFKAFDTKNNENNGEKKKHK